jgi:hypothetical protein
MSMMTKHRRVLVIKPSKAKEGLGLSLVTTKGEVVILAKDQATLKWAFNKLKRKAADQIDFDLVEKAFIVGENSVEIKPPPVFIMNGHTPELVNTYHCSSCKEEGREHGVIRIKAESTSRFSTWGEGIPATKRQCTGCLFEDGPWVSAEHVGGCW